MLKLKMMKIKQMFINAGYVNLLESFIGLRHRLMILFIIGITVSGCTEFALLASGASITASQNVYMKAYNGIDVLTIMRTEKDIKTHVYTKIKNGLESRK